MQIPSTFVFRVLKYIAIRDGDTVQLIIDQGLSDRAKIWLRLDDVDCHETRLGKGRTEETKKLGFEAKAFTDRWLREFIRDGVVHVETTQVPKQSFDRYMGVIVGYKDGRKEILAEKLKEAGYHTGRTWE